jgi:hypothetical protein
MDFTVRLLQPMKISDDTRKGLPLMRQPLLTASLFCSFRCLFRNNGADFSVSALSGESYNTISGSKQSIILSETYVQAGMDMCSALSVKDVAGLNELSVRSLGTQSLGLGITAVLGRTNTFLMSEELKI